MYIETMDILIGIVFLAFSVIAQEAVLTLILSITGGYLLGIGLHALFYKKDL